MDTMEWIIGFVFVCLGIAAVVLAAFLIFLMINPQYLS